MKIFLITDTHLNHDKLVEFGRPKDFQDRIKKGLKYLKDDAVLIHLGDVCIGNDAENNKFFTDLKCKKILVKGNHDNKSNSWYLSNGWDFVCDSFTMKFHGKRLLFTHIPVPDSEDFDFNIHGHLHGNNHREMVYEFPGGIDMAPEIWGYQPIPLTKVIA